MKPSARLKLLAALCATAAIVAAAASSKDDLPVFPGAQGPAARTAAGRGGSIFVIDTLADSGPGSLRECIAAEGPRTCVFSVGGTMVLRSDLSLSNPRVTIAGQSAPSPGITIEGAGLVISASDVLVQHVRIRPGDRTTGPNPENRDAIRIEGSAKRVMIDHVSTAWAIDENIGIWGADVRDVTVSSSIIAEGLNKSLHPKGPHSKGLLAGGEGGSPSGIVVADNLFAHNVDRNPLISSGIVSGNVIFDWTVGTGVRQDQEKAPLLVEISGNSYITSLDSNPLPIAIDRDVSLKSSIAIEGNWVDGKMPENQLDVVRLEGVLGKKVVLKEASSDATSADIESTVLGSAGARPADRDDTDARIVKDVIERSHRLVDCVYSCLKGTGEIARPAAASSSAAVALPPDPNGDSDSDGYTDLEEWLHEKALEVEGL